MNTKNVMNTKSMLTTAAWATGTMMLTLALLWPGYLEAVNEGKDARAPIANPKLEVSGVQLTLVTEKDRVYKAGDKPVLTLQAVNTTDKPVRLEVKSGMTATAPQSKMSRMAVRPVPLWNVKREVEVMPLATATVLLETDKPLPAGKEMTLTLQCSGKAIRAMTFATQGDAGKPADPNATTQPAGKAKDSAKRTLAQAEAHPARS